jgi:anti-sigma factor RsiW
LVRLGPVAWSRRFAAALNRGGEARVEGGVRSPQFHLDHRFAQRRLSAYLDAELEPSELGRVERHIDDCPDCEQTARSLRRTVAALALLRWCKPSRFTANVIERLRLQPRREGDAGRR